MKSINILTISLAATALGNPLQKRNGCHTGNDSIGKYCAYADFESFTNAAANYCALFDHGTASIPQGSSMPVKIDNQPDGYGGQQIFWGNYRVDRGGALTPTFAGCLQSMQNIFQACQGYGGWINTDFGTVFGECIRK